jgi:hypothetical protein
MDNTLNAKLIRDTIVELGNADNFLKITFFS